MAKFEPTYQRTVIGFEIGGVKVPYSNASTDLGKECYIGISRRFNGEWFGWSLIDGHKTQSDFPECLQSDTLLQAKVVEFYHAIWDSLRLEQVASQPLADAIFDFYVSSGDDAVKYLQRALNIRRQHSHRLPLLKIDGVLGMRTQIAIHDQLADSDLLVKMLNGFRATHCMELAEHEVTQVMNIESWFRRW